jgi:hypothetical protein
MRTDFYARLVAICCRRATAVVVAGAIAGLLACICLQNFQMDATADLSA